jgi:pimeloyl-ACP methyl ester carboxylesterase
MATITVEAVDRRILILASSPLRRKLSSYLLSQSMSRHSISFLPPRLVQPHLPLLVLFPGMDGTGKLFNKQIAGLVDRFDTRCLSIATNDLTGWSGLVDRVVSLILSELAKGQALYLCGESFGACCAMQVAEQLGTKISKLVLINPASSFARQPLLAAGSALSGLLPDALYPLSGIILVNFLINGDRVAPTERQNLINAILSVHPKTAAWRLNLLRQFPIDSIVPKLIDIPTLLIAGGLDRLLPSSLEVNILSQLLSNSKTLLLPASGHACLLEKDVNLADLL